MFKYDYDLEWVVVFIVTCSSFDEIGEVHVKPSTYPRANCEDFP